MLGRLGYYLKVIYHHYITYRQFRGVIMDEVKLGPELNKRFEIRHPKNLRIGHKTVISGDLFINAMGGGRNR